MWIIKLNLSRWRLTIFKFFTKTIMMEWIDSRDREDDQMFFMVMNNIWFSVFYKLYEYLIRYIFWKKINVIINSISLKSRYCLKFLVSALSFINIYSQLSWHYVRLVNRLRYTFRNVLRIRRLIVVSEIVLGVLNNTASYLRDERSETSSAPNPPGLLFLPVSVYTFFF